MGLRKSEISRDTSETKIKVLINLDSPIEQPIETGIGFLDHMLHLFAFHCNISLNITADGDLHIDPHHTTEDIGICLGQALKTALGDKKGINRYGSCLMPMDEALCQVALDISNRPHLEFNCSFPSSKCGDFDTELVEEFWNALANNAGLTIHISQLAGKNTHHIIEAVFKGFGQALKQAIRVNTDKVPSSKGTL